MKDVILVIFGAALALPAFAANDDAFLQELSRSDGNVRGEFFKAEISPQGLARLSKADKQFQIEIQRTDGYVAEAAKPEGDVEQTAKAEAAQR